MNILGAMVGTVTRGRALAWGAVVAVALSAGTFATGVHLGRGWERGKRAQLDVAALGEQIAAFSAALAITATDNQAASASLAAIARSTADELDAKRIAADHAARDLDRALAARPDLDAVRVGADILRAWNQGNAGDDTGSAAGAAEPDQAGARHGDDAVPAPAAGSRRQGADSAAQPQPKLGALSPVCSAPGWAGDASARTRTDRDRADCASGGSTARERGVTHG